MDAVAKTAAETSLSSDNRPEQDAAHLALFMSNLGVAQGKKEPEAQRKKEPEADEPKSKQELEIEQEAKDMAVFFKNMEKAALEEEAREKAGHNGLQQNEEQDQKDA